MDSFLIPVFSLAAVPDGVSAFFSSSGVEDVVLLLEPPPPLVPLPLPDELLVLSPVIEAKVVNTWMEACCVGLTGSAAVGGDNT